MEGRQEHRQQEKARCGKTIQRSPSALSPFHLSEVALDLHVVFGAVDDVSSGDEPMGDRPADAASASPLGELPRVTQIGHVFAFALSCLL